MTSINDYAVVMERVYENIFVISLRDKSNNGDLCLTAMNSATPTSGTISYLDAPGNVCWAKRDGSIEQRWIVKEVQEEGQKLIGPYVYTGIKNDYQSEVVRSRCGCYGYSFHYGVDLGGRKENKTEKDIEVKASGNGTVTDIRKVSDDSKTALGNVVVIKYDNVLNTSGENIGTVYFRYCHLASINVSKNQAVDSTTIIGERGTSGSGCEPDQPHLHLEATTLSSASATNSPSEGHTDSQKFDPREVLYTKTSTGGIGIRALVVDKYEPFNSNQYCPHSKAWYEDYAAPEV